MTALATGIRRVSGPDGGIVLDVRRGTMFRLNPLGSKVMDLLERGHSAEEIARDLSREFGVAPNVVEADVREFLVTLKDHGLVDR